MDFNEVEYEKFYWVVYYYAREKYFPNNLWREKKIGDRSPKLWTWKWRDSDDELGRQLFKRGARYFYLVTTYFNETVKIQDVDDNVLDIAFELIGCRIKKSEIKKGNLSRKELNIVLFNLFEAQSERYIIDFPDLKDIVGVINDPNRQATHINNRNIVETVNLEAPVTTESISEDRAYDDLKSQSKAITDLINRYFTLITAGQIVLAFDCWSQDIKLDRWDNNYMDFAQAHFIGLFFQEIKKMELPIWDIKLNSNFSNGFNSATAMVFHEEFAKIPYSQDLDDLKNMCVGDMDDFRARLENMMPLFNYHSNTEWMPGSKNYLEEIPISFLFKTEFLEGIVAKNRPLFRALENIVSDIFPEKTNVKVYRLYKMTFQYYAEQWFISGIDTLDTNTYQPIV